ncbi:MAG: hypothetical protein ACJ73N_00580 [Bryobacteraceae bacterium]
MMAGPYGIRAYDESTNLNVLVAVDLDQKAAVRIIEVIEEVLRLAGVHAGFIVGIERVEEQKR